MPIPTPSGTNGLLPPGRHKATVAEVEATFVTGAPHPTQRRVILDAFEVWRAMWLAILPSSYFWVDGGFVTHKAWPPTDIDVVAYVKTSDLNALTPAQQQHLETNLLTHQAPDGSKITPMGGLVDSYLALRGDAGRFQYWDGLFQRFKRQDGTVDAAAGKGFLEVS